MRIKCATCKKEREIDKERIDLMNCVYQRHHDGMPSPMYYLEIEEIISGRCIYGKSHLFIYDIDFSLQVQKAVESKDADTLEKLTGTRDFKMWS